MNDTNTSLIRTSIIEMCYKGPINYETYNTIPMNSYERNYIVEFLDDDALFQLSKYCLQNVTAYHYPSTYEEAIVTKLFPELLTRFKGKIAP